MAGEIDYSYHPESWRGVALWAREVQGLREALHIMGWPEHTLYQEAHPDGLGTCQEKASSGAQTPDPLGSPLRGEEVAVRCCVCRGHGNVLAAGILPLICCNCSGKGWIPRPRGCQAI
jgi:hypothetical protein